MFWLRNKKINSTYVLLPSSLKPAHKILVFIAQMSGEASGKPVQSRQSLCYFNRQSMAVDKAQTKIKPVSLINSCVCMVQLFSSWEIFLSFLSSSNFFKINFFKNYFRNTIWVSNRLDPDQVRHSVGPDLDPICLQKWAGDNSRQWVKNDIAKGISIKISGTQDFQHLHRDLMIANQC